MGFLVCWLLSQICTDKHLCLSGIRIRYLCVRRRPKTAMGTGNRLKLVNLLNVVESCMAYNRILLLLWDCTKYVTFDGCGLNRNVRMRVLMHVDY
jgi:hypothetical protein